jgi:uncharacterized Tic20 family protein
MSDLPEPTTEEKTMAMLCHLSGFVFPIWGPLILMLVKADSAFIKYHAIQALVFQAVSSVIVFMIVFVGLMVTFGLCFPIVFVAFLPMLGGLMLGLRANEGRWDGYPLMESLGRPQ